MCSQLEEDKNLPYFEVDTKIFHIDYISSYVLLVIEAVYLSKAGGLSGALDVSLNI